MAEGSSASLACWLPCWYLLSLSAVLFATSALLEATTQAASGPAWLAPYSAAASLTRHAAFDEDKPDDAPAVEAVRHGRATSLEAAQAMEMFRTKTAGQVERNVSSDGGKFSRGASLEEVAKLWEALSALPQPEDVPEGLQLLLGIFTAKALIHERAVRAIMARTWMRRRGVCWLQGGQRPGCGVYVAFVLGLSGGERAGSGQELVLNVSEGMNGGKSYEFFRAAPRLFPWLTHVAKSDLDTFVWPIGLLWGLRAWRQLAPHGGCWEFGGRPMFSRDCSPPGCSIPERCRRSDGLGNVANASFMDPECFLIFHGALYLMDRALALRVTAPEAPWSLGKKTGGEDKVTSRYVKETVRLGGACLATWSVLGGFRHYPAKIMKHRPDSRRGRNLLQALDGAAGAAAFLSGAGRLLRQWMLP